MKHAQFMRWLSAVMIAKKMEYGYFALIFICTNRKQMNAARAPFDVVGSVSSVTVR